MRKYAIRKGKIESCDIEKHSNRSESREATETSGSNSFLRSRTQQEETKRQIRFLFEEDDDFEYRLNPVEYQLTLDPRILNDSWIVNLRNSNESIRKKDSLETYQERRQGIQSSDQRRCEAEERDNKTKAGEEEVMKKEKESPKEKKHEAKESKKFEKKEDKKESKGKKK